MKKLTIILLSLILFACDNSESQQETQRTDKTQTFKDTVDINIIEGYQPSEPIDFPHSVHAAENGIDCRYCHKTTSSEEKVTPSHSICLDCHKVNSTDLNSGTERDMINQLSDSIRTQPKQIVWRKVDELPDSVFFFNQFK